MKITFYMPTTESQKTMWNKFRS